MNEKEVLAIIDKGIERVDNMSTEEFVTMHNAYMDEHNDTSEYELEVEMFSISNVKQVK